VDKTTLLANFREDLFQALYGFESAQHIGQTKDLGIGQSADLRQGVL
jgi:hypothetical protein